MDEHEVRADDAARHGDHDDPRRLEAEGETALARLALDSGELEHAATHVGNAMAEDPLLPDVHAALAELARHAGGAEAALELFPADGPLHIGAAVCRASLHASCLDWAPALELVGAAIGAQYQRPWSHVAWLAQGDVAAVIAPGTMATAVSQAVQGNLPEPLPEEHRPALRPFYDLTAAVIERHPEAATLHALGSALARRLGDTERAVAWAEQARRVQPGFVTSVMLGYALRAAGRADDALRVWQDELARDPSDLDLHVDIAELYAATDRPAEGLAWLERALAADPEHPKAAPALHGLRHALDGDPAHLVALADHLREHPAHPYAGTVLAQHSRRQPWLGAVAIPTEATVNALRQFLESGDAAAAREHEIALATSAIEPPSSFAAFRLAFPRAEMTYQSVGEPDPRRPVGPDPVHVWRNDGLDPLPAVAPPAPDAAELVRQGADVAWPHLPAAYDHAVRLSSVPLDDLLGVLVHPPEPADDEQGRALLAHGPELWIRAVQTHACLGLAHHATDQPWAGSTRRAVLTGLLNGPEDWVNEAAGVALVASAWVHPEIRGDVGDALAARLAVAAAAYRTREVTILGSLARLTLLCPWLDAERRSFARTVLDAVERADAEEPPDREEREREVAEAARAAAEGHGPARERPRRRLFRRR